MPGLGETLIILTILGAIVLPIVSLVDIANKPESAFASAGTAGRTTWILLIVLTFFVLGIGSLVASIVWLVRGRPRVMAAMTGTS